MESNKIRAQRADYLMEIEKHRENDFKIYYTDETWCGKNHTRQFGWIEKISEKDFSNFDQYRGSVQEIDGFRGGFVKPSGAGKRIIILHIGSSDGFLPNGMNCFIAKKDSADYHNEMNSQHYEEWFRTILNLIPSKSVIVLDQATYHTTIDPEFRNPTTAWRKDDIIEWAENRKVPLPEGRLTYYSLTKPQLIERCRPYHFPKIYKLDTITKEIRGDEVKLLWLPVAHCEFNPIELIWAFVKNYVAKHNTTFKLQDVYNLCVHAMENVPEDLWSKCCNHSLKEENKYRESESIVQHNVDNIIIQVRANDSDTDSYNSSENEDLEEY
ncbi:uncharacterized protein LOC122511314 [Leptopilina heterotoma]|uniref:uncharacterized protein LOC122502389 n=1 Tax=Leptopilina heterotoma TaxID=63436 RepID=UPI001CA9D7D3|nr:uncharacterized protein LOC122502389 [Leptopilina heterotoma]XP_043482408.1 uncharacterized protein LOC122511314 [Leptopilina heterotoma]